MKKVSIAILSMVFLVNCKSTKNEWTDLLAEDSLKGWHFFQDNGSKKGWIVENGVLTFNGVSDMESGEGDASLLSDKVYENFEIQFDWKIMPGGNSGFMWAVQDDPKYKYPYQTGPEIQILDAAMYQDTSIVLGGDIEIQNVLGDLESRKRFVGSLYDLSAPTVLDASKPANEWNSYHIKINYRANRGEVMLNGVKINSFPLQGPDWDAMVAKSKFGDSESADYIGGVRWEDFGKFSKGYICFQDHPGEVSFKNIRIRELD